MNEPDPQRAASSPGGFEHAPTIAAVLGAVVLVLAISFVIESASLSSDSNFSLLDSLLNVILPLAFAVVGLVVARKQPSNPIGWLLLGGAALLMLSEAATGYVALVYRFGHGAWPLGGLAVLLGLLWTAAIVVSPVAILLFPEGRLPSPRWRWVLRAYLSVGALWIACFYVVASSQITGRQFAVNLAGDLAVQDNPTRGLALTVSTVEIVLQILLAIFWLSMVGRVALSYRRASGQRRQQLKWLLSGATITIVATVFTIFVGSQNPSPAVVTLLALTSLLIAAAPVSIGVSILKYRLYEIDRLISRTLSYAIVSGLLVGTFIAIVALSTQVLPLSSRVAVAAATLAVAALFNPFRARVQRLVDRRFNRARYNADATVAAFTATLRDAVELDTICGELLDAVDRAVEPTHAALWLRGSDRGPQSP